VEQGPIDPVREGNKRAGKEAGEDRRGGRNASRKKKPFRNPKKKKERHGRAGLLTG